ncbi:MAG TPA: hypothetical protein VG966_13895 [Hyphomicrobiaceae bacterium]|nr:hypothetical protein [Hyphomicrobiaceae bacterium]
MSMPCRSERGQLSHEEFETIRVTHHPAIYDLDATNLRALKLRLREQRDKARALARQKQREMRGKAEPRGGSFPGTAEQPLKRKQIFAAALKRINKELDRLRKLEARTTHIEAARAALAQHRAAQFVHRPAAADTPHVGMQPQRNPRRRTRVPRSKIGSVSQATKVAQAMRDSRK